METAPVSRGRIVQYLLRWTPAAAVIVTATLLAASSVQSDRPRPGAMVTDVDPPSADYSAARRRTDGKFEVVADLLAGRLTAAEAHGRFLDANRADPKALEYLRAGLPGETDEDRTAYQLVLFIRGFRHPSAKDVAAAVGRELLGRELPPGYPPAPDRKPVPAPQ
jgi:hypothetical protein